MSNTITEVLLEGRIVMGHPMIRNKVTKIDPQTKQEVPVLNAEGVQATESYFALAIPKNGSQDWRTTDWGKIIYDRGVQDFPRGEHGAPTFAWKITDGDSLIPNKVGKVPATREGWPGNWIINCTTRFNISCYHVGKYDPLQQIANDNEIKTGDYARVLINVKGNESTQSPGVYINPKMLELSRAGEPIISEGGPSASEVFGNGATQAPAASVPGAGPAAPLAPPPAPAHDLLQAPEVKYQLPDGSTWSKEQLVAVGYTEEVVAALPKAS